MRSATGLTSATATAASAPAWPVLALLPALGLVAVGARVLLTGRRWAGSSRFEAPAPGAGPAPGTGAGTGPDGTRPSDRADRPAPPASGGARPASRSALWDDLSRGEDPTTGPGGS